MNDTDIIAEIAPDAVSLMDKAIAEIKRLRKENATLTAERDEARREICFLTVFDPEVPHADCSIYEREVATKRGWDCFPQEDGK